MTAPRSDRAKLERAEQSGDVAEVQRIERKNFPGWNGVERRANQLDPARVLKVLEGVTWGAGGGIGWSPFDELVAECRAAIEARQ